MGGQIALGELLGYFAIIRIALFLGRYFTARFRVEVWYTDLGPFAVNYVPGVPVCFALRALLYYGHW
jgi:hypothetical protein